MDALIKRQDQFNGLAFERYQPQDEPNRNGDHQNQYDIHQRCPHFRRWSVLGRTRIGNRPNSSNNIVAWPRQLDVHVRTFSSTPQFKVNIIKMMVQSRELIRNVTN